eukprot:COSAG05_NODE_6813_length_898_cov_1.416771_1_plen_24_part_10
MHFVTRFEYLICYLRGAIYVLLLG